MATTSNRRIPHRSKYGRIANSAAPPLGDRGPVSISIRRPLGVETRVAPPWPTSKDTTSRVGPAPRSVAPPQTDTVAKRSPATTHRHRFRGRGHCASATTPATRAAITHGSGTAIRNPAHENHSPPYRDVARSPRTNRSAALPNAAPATVHAPPVSTVRIAAESARPVQGIPTMLRRSPATDTHPKW